MLEKALPTTASDPLAEYAERVEFFQAGLEHARFSARFMGTLDMGKMPGDRDGFVQAQDALKDLVAFRRAKEHLFISDDVDAAAYRSPAFGDTPMDMFMLPVKHHLL